MSEPAKWELVNPEGAVLVEAGQLNPHPADLTGKAVVLRWDCKQNGDVFLTRIGELFTERVKDLKVIKGWEAAPDTNRSSNNPDTSKKFAQQLAELKPDIVIGAQGD